VDVRHSPESLAAGELGEGEGAVGGALTGRPRTKRTPVISSTRTSMIQLAAPGPLAAATPRRANRYRLPDHQLGGSVIAYRPDLLTVRAPLPVSLGICAVRGIRARVLRVR